MTVIQTLNATVAQIEGQLKGGRSVQDVARDLSEPPANVYAVWRDLRDRGLVDDSKTQAPPVAGGRALASVPTSTATVASAPPSVDALVSAAARSTSKRTQALGVKLHDLATVLRQRLTDERDAAEVAERQTRERAAAAAEVARLEAALREAKAKVGGKAPSRKGVMTAAKESSIAKKREAARGEFLCEKGCGRVATTKAGQRAHERHCGGAA